MVVIGSGKRATVLKNGEDALGNVGEVGDEKEIGGSETRLRLGG